MQKKVFTPLLLSLISLSLILPSFSFASVFDNAYVRLNSQKPNTALSGTVCAQPSSAGAGTEAKVVVEFPTGFTVSSTASNWTTSTTNLPAGSTSWPGIGATATNASGRGITFASNDLTSNVLYCFNFSGASSLTGSTGDGQVGTISTKNSSNASVDLTTYSVSVISNNNINVTASVDPQISDLPITLESDDTGTQFNQGTILSYTITYGTNTAGTIPLTIKAEWSKGTITGSPTPSVDLLDYVIGSASNGYGSTAPVINTVDRSITWTISSFPGNTTNQTVTFKLKTNDSYTGSEAVDFSILADSSSGSTVTPNQEVDQSYAYKGALITATPTDNPSSNSNSSPTPTITITPTPISAAFSFNEISIRTISDHNATIFIETSENAILSIKYGTSLTNLTKTIAVKTYGTQDLIEFPDLEPNTDYFFKVSAKNINGKRINSDNFALKTAIKSVPAEVNLGSLIATSNNSILSNPTQEETKKEKFPHVVIPANSVFEIQFSVGKKTDIKSVQLVVRNTRVLGINNFFKVEEVNAASNLVDMVEAQPGVYTGKLATKPEPGRYDIFVRISDNNGNITEQKIAELIVATKFTVLEKANKNPIENARVLLYLFNETKRLYEIISPQILSIANPVFSEFDGSVKIVLPFGKYKAEITTLGYKSQTIEFEINKYSENYPTALLIKDPFSILNIIKYYYLGVQDVFIANGKLFAANLGQSLRFFDLVSGLSLIFLVILSLFAFTKRNSMPFSSIYSYFFYLLDKNARNEKYIHGVVYNAKEKPIVGVNVYLSDSKTEEIIDNTKTNQNGEFYFKKRKNDCLVMATKAGFHPTPLLAYKEQAHLKFKINLKQSGLAADSIDKTKNIIEGFIGMIFKLLLFWSFVFELIFLDTFGVIKTAPFIIISLFNLSLWILHINHKRSIQV